MRYLFALTILSTSFATNAGTGPLDYHLEVNGMVCAYCAYNVSKQLRSIDAIVPESVDVDLDQGAIKLQSEKELDQAELADLLLQAGFELGSVTEAVALTPQARRHSDERVFLSVTMDPDGLSDGEFNLVLEALGDIVVQRSGRISIVGPTEYEVAILKPVLAGRKTVIEVEYDPTNRPDQPIVLSVSVNSMKTRE
ncbi:MAG: heavy-metal-associated domain-containing protein [Woeseia sp.]